MLEASPPTSSPRLGDFVVVRRDVLAEVARAQAHALPSWRFVAAGTRGKLIGWREREGGRIVLDVRVEADEPRLVVYVRDEHVARPAS